MTRIIALDQGTSSTRAISFDLSLTPLHRAQREFPQHFPQNGWVEHDPEDIWTTALTVLSDVLAADPGTPVAAIGVTNQRETVVVWNRHTGQPVYNAIVWQDRRTAPFCQTLTPETRAMIRARTGLVADPYFSATKLRWILDTVPNARAAAKAGDLLAGTIDSFLIWRLTGGRVHATDATNASRTMLYDIHQRRWSQTLCDLLGIPMQMLPDVRDSAGDYGTTDPALTGTAIPILGVAGDQQSAAIGQGCLHPGGIKATYGTGCFMLLNTGSDPVQSAHSLLTTVACQINGKPSYALEGSIFVAGSGVQWLRDALGFLQRADQSQDLAELADPTRRLILVPAFTGLGAPHWDADCRGAIFGLTRGAGPAEFARATLESIGFQTRDLLDAMLADYHGPADILRVDGGMAASDWTMQFLADILAMPVERPTVLETTALGVARLAGWQAGVLPQTEGFGLHLDRRFLPAIPAGEGERLMTAWHAAVKATRMVPVL